MKRLTHYNEKDKRYDIKNAYLEDLEQDLKYDGIAWLRIYEAYQELGKLEDLEELCEKMVSQPIYEKYEDNGEIHKEDYTEYQALYNFKKRRIELYGYEIINGFEIDKYGKTWALTKEELEYGND